MSLYNNRPSIIPNRTPDAVDEFAAALESVKSGTGINPSAQQLKRDYILQDIVQKDDANKAYKFLNDFLLGKLGDAVAQVNPTYPAGDPRYGQPMLLNNRPTSVNAAEYDIIQRLNELRRSNPAEFERVKSTMGPYGYSQPVTGIWLRSHLSIF